MNIYKRRRANMISLVLLSHSKKLVEGLKELIMQMTPDIDLYIVGGTAEGGIGSDYEETLKVINEAYREEGVVVLFDLGSTYMTVDMVLDSIEVDRKSRIKVIDAALVEGGVTAAVAISGGSSLQEIEESLKPLKLGKF